MFPREKNAILEWISLDSTAVTLTANGERRESHVVSDKESATKFPDVTTSTTVAQASPRDLLLVAPSLTPENKDAAEPENAFPLELLFKKKTHASSTSFNSHI